jgi:hypothetical protein
LAARTLPKIKASIGGHDFFLPQAAVGAGDGGLGLHIFYPRRRCLFFFSSGNRRVYF